MELYGHRFDKDERQSCFFVWCTFGAMLLYLVSGIAKSADARLFYSRRSRMTPRYLVIGVSAFGATLFDERRNTATSRRSISAGLVGVVRVLHIFVLISVGIKSSAVTAIDLFFSIAVATKIAVVDEIARIDTSDSRKRMIWNPPLKKESKVPATFPRVLFNERQSELNLNGFFLLNIFKYLYKVDCSKEREHNET